MTALLNDLVPLLLGLTVVGSVALSVLAFSRHREPGARWFGVLGMSVALWSISNIVQVLATDPDVKRATVTTAFLGICLVAYTFWRAVMARGPGVPGAPPRWLAWALGVPIAVTPLVVGFTSAPGPFFRELTVPDGVGPVTSEPAVLFSIHMLWAYGLTVWALGALAWLIFKLPHITRRAALLMWGAVLTPLVANAVLVAGAQPLAGHDPTPVAGLLAMAGLLAGFRRARLLEVDAGLLPVARNAAVDSMAEGLIVLDQRHRVVDLNPAAAAMLATSLATGIASDAGDLLPGWRPPGDPGRRWEFQTTADGVPRRLEAHARTLTAPRRRPGYLVLVRDITEERNAQRALEENLAAHRHAAEHDPLTGLPNRVLLFAWLEQRLAASSPVALMLLDLDGFKSLNDTFGHRAGDRVLCEVAARLERAVGSAGRVARLAGDEFAVLPAACDQPTVADLADRLISGLSRPFVVEGNRARVGASIGIAHGPGDGAVADALVHAADVAMYHAKRTAANWTAYRPELDARRPEQLILGHELIDALDHDRLVVHFQPERSLTGRIRAVEALVRWDHPERGLLAPDVFLPTIENSDLMCRLTDRVLDRSLWALGRWEDAQPDLRIAVNLSARDLGDTRLPERLEEILGRHGTPADRVILEVTENAVSTSQDTMRLVERLRRRGFRIALDDFGTGAAPLSVLRELAVDELKIDRSFVGGFDRPRDAAVVRAMIHMGHDLGLTVVAEGVERPATAAALRAAGCDAMQGFLIGRPRPAADLDLRRRFVRHEAPAAAAAPESVGGEGTA